MSRYRDLLARYFLPQWPSALSICLLLVGAAAIEVVQPRIIAGFIDSARAGAANDVLVAAGFGFIALVVVGQAVGLAEAYLAERLALIATNRLRADLTLHCLRLDLSFHNETRPGELIQRIDGDVTSLTNFFSRFLVALIANGLVLLGALVMVATLDLGLGAVLVGFCVVAFAIAYRLRFVARPLWERALQAQADQSGFLEEHLSATEDIRSSGATPYAMIRFYEHARELLRRRRIAIFVNSAVGNTTGGLFTIGTAAALAFGAWLFRRGDITIGGVFLIFSYTEMLARPIQAINRQLQDLQTAAAAVRRVDELLATRPVVFDGPGVAMPSGPLRVELAEIEFSYVHGEPVLHDVSVEVTPGAVLGLLGRTGSGKTTIGRLLLRFYDPDGGTVRVGDVDLRRPRLQELRTRVGLVTQEVQLFQASVRDNLTFFDESSDDARIEQVLADLGLERWLRGLPDGLDTVLSSGGLGLSAGEAQLLAFARVFLRDPGLVILDEATSRLDPATERLVEHAVERLFEGRTAIVIAHRLRTVLRADDILVLEEGRVLEHGPRAALQDDPSSRFAQLLRTGLEDVLQ